MNLDDLIDFANKVNEDISVTGDLSSSILQDCWPMTLYYHI